MEFCVFGRPGVAAGVAFLGAVVWKGLQIEKGSESRNGKVPGRAAAGGFW